MDNDTAVVPPQRQRHSGTEGRTWPSQPRRRADHNQSDKRLSGLNSSRQSRHPGFRNRVLSKVIIVNMHLYVKLVETSNNLTRDI